MPRKKKARVFTREEKLAALRRMIAGENVSALARELKLRRKLLYAWLDRFRAGGPEALRTRGRPGKADRLRAQAQAPPSEALSEQAKRRIAELERKVGQQQLELDFFRQALRQVEAKRRPKNGSGAKSSTPSSRS
jgi:transposase